MVEVGSEGPQSFSDSFPFLHSSSLSFATYRCQLRCILHLDSYKHSTSRRTVVTINMYTKAIALAILAVAGVQAQSDYDYE